MLGVDPSAVATAYQFKAITPAIVFRLRIEDLFDVMEDHFEVARDFWPVPGRRRDVATRRRPNTRW